MIFGVALSFIDLSLCYSPQMIIKGIVIWIIWRPDVWGDVIAEIF